MQQRIRRAMVVCLLPATFTAACGKSGGEETDAAPPTSGADASRGYDTPPIAAMVEAVQSPAAFAGLMCEKIWTCCSPAEQAKLPVADQAACERDFADLLRPTAMQIAESVTAGRVGYDGAALGTCLRAYQSAGCAAATPLGTVISHRQCAFLTPLVDIGQPCQQHFECKGGYCAMGACVAKKADGQPCAEDDECPVRCGRFAPRTCAGEPPQDLCQAL